MPRRDSYLLPCWKTFAFELSCSPCCFTEMQCQQHQELGRDAESRAPCSPAYILTSSLVIPWHIGEEHRSECVTPRGGQAGSRALRTCSVPSGASKGFIMLGGLPRVTKLMTSGAIRSGRPCVCWENSCPPLFTPARLHLCKPWATTKVIRVFSRACPPPPGQCHALPGSMRTQLESETQNKCQLQGIFNPNPSGKAAHEILACQHCLPPLSQEELVLPW